MKQVFEKLIEVAQDYQDDNQDHIMDIESILEGRSQFGEHFTKEVDHQLQSWGVQSVKCIELMDIRDAEGSKVIANIMEKKKSLIEMESRTAVAENKKKAEIAEVEAAREVSLQKQEAEQQIGIRNAEKEQKVEAEKARVQTLAEARKQESILIADGDLALALKNAEGIKAKGLAEAEANTAMQMAPVKAQTVLASEIGANKEYQTYLLEIRRIEATESIGKEQAKALEKAQVKVIANAGDAATGLNSVGELFTPKGGGSTRRNV